jgi:hypothetical protein
MLFLLNGQPDMSTSQQPPAAPTGPGFLTVILDIPFGVAIPNGSYTVYDPVKGIAVVQTTLKEGSRTFFRNAPIVGPTSFRDLQSKAREYERPREEYSYLATSRLKDGTEKATLNIHCRTDGGFAETKYYSEVQVTFLEDDLSVIGRKDNYVLQRATDILNSFLDKYRLLAEDYRVSRVSAERNYYLATCHSSPLAVDERTLTPEQLFAGLSKGRMSYHRLGHGGANIIRANSLDHLGPRPQIAGSPLETLIDFFQTKYEMPLSYDLVMQALQSLQIDRDFKLAIVHAATAVEVHVLHLLYGLLIALGRSTADAWNILENDPEYEGVTKRLKRLESHTKTYCDQNGTPYIQFVGGALFNRWRDILAHKRNRAVHAGLASFTWAEGLEAIGIAKESIIFLDQRVPSLANNVQLNPSITSIREGAGGILF